MLTVVWGKRVVSGFQSHPKDLENKVSRNNASPKNWTWRVGILVVGGRKMKLKII